MRERINLSTTCRAGALAKEDQLSTSPILFVADLLHPVDRFAVQRFLNGDMSHCGRRRSAVPMLLTGRKPDHIAWPDLLDRAVPTLRPTKAGCDDQRLTEWMRMPRGASARLERDACATNIEPVPVPRTAGQCELYR